MDHRSSLLAFSTSPGMGVRRISNLVRVVGNVTDAWNANKQTFKQADIGEKVFLTFDEYRKKFQIEQYLERMEKAKVEFITIDDPEYPDLLREIPDAPLVLYLKGNPKFLPKERGVTGVEGFPTAVRWTPDRTGRKESVTGPVDGNNPNPRIDIPWIPDQVGNDKKENMTNHPTFAIVGTRKTSSYGGEITQKIAREIAGFGVTIVSGLALGVDAIAHQAALDSNSPTIAVLGCGVDCCFPRENQRLYDQIIELGSLIISEYPLSQPGNQGTFPARNRIVAGLSLGVLVTEAATGSGSLITADYAAKFGRPIFSIPGPITSAGSAGTTQLLKQGARLITTGSEIMEALNISNSHNKTTVFQNLSEDEQKIVELLQSEPLSIDDLSNKTDFKIPQLMSLLTNLELRSIIQNSGNQEYRLNI